MFKEFPKALYKGGAWDGVSEPDCVTVSDSEEQAEQAEAGYFPLGERPQMPPAPEPEKAAPSPDPQSVKRGPGRPRKEVQ